MLVALCATRTGASAEVTFLHVVSGGDPGEARRRFEDSVRKTFARNADAIRWHSRESRSPSSAARCRRPSRSARATAIHFFRELEEQGRPEEEADSCRTSSSTKRASLPEERWVTRRRRSMVSPWVYTALGVLAIAGLVLMVAGAGGWPTWIGGALFS